MTADGGGEAPRVSCPGQKAQIALVLQAVDKASAPRGGFDIV